MNTCTNISLWGYWYPWKIYYSGYKPILFEVPTYLLLAYVSVIVRFCKRDGFIISHCSKSLFYSQSLIQRWILRVLVSILGKMHNNLINYLQYFTKFFLKFSKIKLFFFKRRSDVLFFPAFNWNKFCCVTPCRQAT